jgi:hypothetical protein
MAEVSSGGERKRMSGCNGDTLRRDALKRTDSAVCGRVISCSRGLASIVRYNFPVRGDMPEVKFTWYDGGLKPARPPRNWKKIVLSRETTKKTRGCSQPNVRWRRAWAESGMHGDSTSGSTLSMTSVRAIRKLSPAIQRPDFHGPSLNRFLRCPRML